LAVAKNKYEEAAIIGVDPEDVDFFDRAADKYVSRNPGHRWLLRRASREPLDLFDPMSPSHYDDVQYATGGSHGFDIIGGVNA